MAVRTDRDPDGGTQAANLDNHIVGSAFENISMEHGQAFHTVIDRDHRPHRVLVEQLITPQMVQGLLFANSLIQRNTKSVVYDMHFLRALHYPADQAQTLRLSDQNYRGTMSCARTQSEIRNTLP